MISSSALVHRWGAPDPGPGRFYVVTATQAESDEDYCWGDSVTVSLLERRTRTVTKGWWPRRRQEEVTENEVIRSAYRPLVNLRNIEEAIAVVVAACEQLVADAKARDAHNHVVARLVAQAESEDKDTL